MPLLKGVSVRLRLSVERRERWYSNEVEEKWEIIVVCGRGDVFRCSRREEEKGRGVDS